MTSGAPTGTMNGPNTAVGTHHAARPVRRRPGSTRAVPVSVPAGPGLPTSVGLPIFEGRHSSTAQVPTVMADTGKTQAVRRGAPDGLLMVLVRSLVIVSAILILVGTAWLVINRVHPQWLADLRLPYTSTRARASGTTADHRPRPSAAAPKQDAAAAAGLGQRQRGHLLGHHLALRRAGQRAGRRHLGAGQRAAQHQARRSRGS